ncbi:hypothetical protein OG568_04045 [Streptomyces sp. NBC_01450]|uniref:hypothetical protein n=1 Tax=Streptomyces sp. NBC_01450 TaxID=2903871 RepID=UPI002E2F13C8|nr:hypothetical protein [Streptomyces sp. NBC_01450]
MGTQVTSWDAGGADRVVAVRKAVADPSCYRLLCALSGSRGDTWRARRLTSPHLARLRKSV